VRNPWLKKNPLLSMWMSGANTMLGSARGHATAATRRQAATVTAVVAEQTARYWSAILAPQSGKSRKSRK
jgi:hypothetical protein